MPIFRTSKSPSDINWASAPESPVAFPAGMDIAVIDSPSGGQRIAAHDDTIIRVLWTPEGTRLVTVCLDGTIKIWDPTTLENIKTHTMNTGIFAATISPDGNYLAISGENHAIKIMHLTLGTVKNELIAHVDTVNSLEWSPNGLKLFSGGRDNTVAIWDAKYGKLLKRISLDGWINAIKINRLETSVAVGGIFSRIYMLDAVSLETTTAIDGPSGGTSALGWSPSSNELLAGGRDGEVKYWKFKYGRIYGGSGSFRAHGKRITAIEVSPDSRWLATASEDRTIRLWSFPAMQLQKVAPFDSNLSTLSWAPDGSLLSVGDSSGMLYILDPETLPVPHMFSAHEKQVTAVAVSPSGSYIASASQDKVLIVWNRKGKVISRTVLPEPATSIKWDPSEKYLNINDALVFQFMKL